MQASPAAQSRSSCPPGLRPARPQTLGGFFGGGGCGSGAACAHPTRDLPPARLGRTTGAAAPVPPKPASCLVALVSAAACILDVRVWFSCDDDAWRRAPAPPAHSAPLQAQDLPRTHCPARPLPACSVPLSLTVRIRPAANLPLSQRCGPCTLAAACCCVSRSPPSPLQGGGLAGPAPRLAAARTTYAAPRRHKAHLPCVHTGSLQPLAFYTHPPPRCPCSTQALGLCCP